MVKNLVEAWGQVLIISGYEMMVKFSANLIQNIFPNLLAQILPSPVACLSLAVLPSMFK